MNGNYLKETKRFAYGVLAVLPLLAFYEYGIWQGSLGDHLNGADAILRLALYTLTAAVGIRGSTWVVAVVVGILAFGFLWYVRRERMKISLGYLIGMYAEAAIMGGVLAVVVYLILGHHLPRLFSFEPNTGVISQLRSQGLSSPWAKVVAAVGAGVFEELLFRVLLLGILYKLFARTGAALGQDGAAAAKAIFFSSAVFTALHYGAATGGGLLSIFVSSVLLSGLYLQRGYGMVALVHTAYDLYLIFGVVA